MRTAIAASFAFLASPVVAQTHIAPTNALTPSDERKTFHLPPGFEVQLVAAEPDIGKPIQMAFDAKGRLWVTTSRHYPFPAEGRASDRLFVLSDFGPDGRAKKVETFAADLNIPIGILPLPDCKSCLVSNVGRVLKLTDTNGDGRADQRETILSGFGTVDTHGMMNSFLLLPDGWVYATHGFRNESVVKAKDGSVVRMQSGNTFRFRPDGSRIEPWTFGQVNPFGLCVDPWLNLYTADCHSKPITQLIRGAYYQSFGKPHDGLGYAPHVTRHDHKSTALCGLVWYEADHFPNEWRGCMFLGNVTGNRVNVDRIAWHGATPVAQELPDFLTSSDPWFRPTDVKLGPDGALYVADFYNKIIGHYEVDLKHPGRDKDRGRVWRVVYTGTNAQAKPPMMPGDLTVANWDALTKSQAASNITTRLLAAQQAVARFTGPTSRVLDPAEARRMIERTTTGPHLLRSSVDSLIARPQRENIAPLLRLLHATPVDDTHLRFATRVALRNALRDADGAWAEAASADPTVIGDVALGVHSHEAAAYLLKQLQAGRTDPAVCQHIGRYGTDADAVAAVGGLKAAPVGLLELVRGLQARGAGVPPEARATVEAACATGLHANDGGIVQASTDLATALRLVSAFEPLAKSLTRPDRTEAQRGAALAALLAIDPQKATPILSRLLADPAAAFSLQQKAAETLAGSNRSDARAALLTVVQTAPAKLAAVVATALASSPPGIEALLDAVKAGKASARLLQEPPVAFRIALAEGGKYQPRLQELTRGLPTADAKLSALIRTRAAGFAQAKADPALGKAVFTKNCAICHQLHGEGAKVGPQLDGIGARGADRLLEDILDPNRNVDGAFRATTLTMLDGRTLVGQLVREEGQVSIIVDAAGKEQRAEAKDVEKKTISPLSVMPANMDATVSEADFYHLIAYLLEQRAKTP